jgi:uncharacterized protein YcgI (DUF1989 family)
MRRRIEACTGTGFELRRGQELSIVDLEGEQVADLYCIALGSPTEWLSSGRSFDYNGTLYLTKGHVLYSNASRPLLTIVADDVGRHDFHYAPCSREMFRIQYGEEEHPNCLDNLAAALRPHGVEADAIATPFNVFMNAEVTATGELVIRPPRSRAGDAVRFRAELDLAVAVSACSAPTCNNGHCGPMAVEIT